MPTDRSITQRVFFSSPHEWTERFSQVAGIRELDSGGVLVADSRERTVLQLRFNASGSDAVGKEGSGWNEYRLPTALLAAGDSTVIYDAMGRRLLLVDRGMKIVGGIPVPEELRGARPVGIDVQHRVYLEGAPDAAGIAAGMDSVLIYRWSIPTREIRRLLLIDGTDRALHSVRRRIPGGVETIRILLPEPFSSSDEWGVGPQGQLLVVRATPFSVELRDSDGKLVREAQPPAFHHLPVTSADRRELARAPTQTDWTIPNQKPIAVDGSAMISPEGYLWVQLHGPSGADSTDFLVVSVDGEAVAIATISSRFRLAGLGLGSAYLAQKDSVDLIGLSRWSLRYPTPNGISPADQNARRP